MSELVYRCVGALLQPDPILHHNSDRGQLDPGWQGAAEYAAAHRSEATNKIAGTRHRSWTTAKTEAESKERGAVRGN